MSWSATIAGPLVAGSPGQPEEEADAEAVCDEQPADPALVAAEQHQRPDGDRYGGADQGDERVHVLSVGSRRCPRLHARELFPSRSGLLDRARRVIGRATVRSVEGRRSRITERSAPCRSARSRGSCPGPAPSPALPGSPRTSCSTSYSTDAPGRGSVEVINGHLGLNIGSVSCLVVMGVPCCSSPPRSAVCCARERPARRRTRASPTAGGSSSRRRSPRWRSGPRA